MEPDTEFNHPIINTTEGKDFPFLIKKASFLNELPDLNDVLCEIVKRISSLPERLDYFTIYIDGHLSKEYEIKASNHPPETGENFKQWLARIFSDRNFGMIISNIEKFDQDFLAPFAEYFKPMVKKNMPDGGMDLSFFIGNYSRTPFGAHLDYKISHLFQFNFGPDEKDFTVWEPEEFKKITGSSHPFLDVGKIIHLGESFTLIPGSCLFMPGRFYHVGRNKGFSIALSVAWNKMSVGEIIDKSMSDARKFTISTDALSGKDLIEKRNEIVKEGFRSWTLNEWYSFALENYYLSLESNGGFRSFPLRDHLKEIDLTNKNIGLFKPFPLKYRKTKEFALIFARGYAIKISDFPKLPLMIDLLNSGNPFHKEDLLRGMVERERINVMKLLSLFISLQAVKIIG